MEPRESMNPKKGFVVAAAGWGSRAGAKATVLYVAIQARKQKFTRLMRTAGASTRSFTFRIHYICRGIHNVVVDAIFHVRCLVFDSKQTPIISLVLRADQFQRAFAKPVFPQLIMELENLPCLHI